MTFYQKNGSVTTAATDKPDRYPYTHHGPAVHGSKLTDYLISEVMLRLDRQDMLKDRDA